MDSLGESGREAIDACVKVSVYKKKGLWKFYDKEEAMRRVRGCHLPIVDRDYDLNRVLEANKFDILDIYNVVLDLENLGLNSQVKKCDKEWSEMEGNQRKEIEAEYNQFRGMMESSEQGTGTVIRKHFVLTCWHVVKTVLQNDEFVIFISNEQTKNELLCKVIYDEEAKDLALLHCLRLSASDIFPLQLSHEIQKVGFKCSCYGYPKNYNGTKAKCVDGMISRIPQERLGLMVLCTDGANHGFSGGPVLLEYNSKMIMIGVAKEKRIIQILTREDQEFLKQLCEKATCENVDDLPDVKKAMQITDKLEEITRNYPSGLTNAIM